MVPNKIIVHHSFTKDSGTVSWLAIRKYHMTPEAQGGPVGGPWKDIGYHAGIELVQTGDISSYEILMGRPWDMPGAHTVGENSVSLGVCFVGNYDEVEPPKEILVVGAKLLRFWLLMFGLTPSDIYRHSQFNPKSCPGTKFDMKRLIDLI